MPSSDPGAAAPTRRCDGESAVLLTDRFEGLVRPGKVVGTRTADGHPRGGVDVEGVLSIDNGALRVQPLIEPGWARAGLAYGPFRREAGLAFAVFMLNGHNTSQSEPLPDSLRNRLQRWWLGSETSSPTRRLVGWLRSGRAPRMVRQLRWWWRLSGQRRPIHRLDENLAVGWFAEPNPREPAVRGNALIMHATGPENGELQAIVSGVPMTAAGGIQNLQIQYVVMLRERGAAYYAASVSRARGIGEYPFLRPLALDAVGDDAVVFAGIHQPVLGQIGFRADSRVYAARVAVVPAWSRWYGSAHAADRLRGEGDLGAGVAEVGGAWTHFAGHCQRREEGIVGIARCNVAVLFPAVASGLVCCNISTATSEARGGLVWRALDDRNYWSLLVGAEGFELSRTQDGHRSVVATDSVRRTRPGSQHALQLLDDGRAFSACLDGQLLFDSMRVDDRLADATGVGICVTEPVGDVRVRDFEAHPRRCELPRVLDLGEPWTRFGGSLVIAEDFEGHARDLAGKRTTEGGRVWERSIGSGHIDVRGSGCAKVRATRERPNPGRLAYMVDWGAPEFADLEVEITPPGERRGQGDRGRSGLIFYQDSKNYLAVNIWLEDTYGGASISSFFQIDGFEDLYDAIWTNVGDRVVWGRPLRFRVTFDGMRYQAALDDEPVLYRALTDVYPDSRVLRINRVGLLTNWEWGNDTGSEFRRFRGRA